MDSFPGCRREKPGREYLALSWRQPCLPVYLSPRSPNPAQKTLGLGMGRKDRGWRKNQDLKITCCGALVDRSWELGSCPESPGCLAHLLMEETLGTVSLSQMPSARSRSRISQANIVGFCRLYSAILSTTLGVATLGLEPPITPGLMLPVS